MRWPYLPATPCQERTLRRRAGVVVISVTGNTAQVSQFDQVTPQVAPPRLTAQGTLLAGGAFGKPELHARDGGRTWTKVSEGVVLMHVLA
jgi:hypothetical protein